MRYLPTTVTIAICRCCEVEVSHWTAAGLTWSSELGRGTFVLVEGNELNGFEDIFLIHR